MLTFVPHKISEEYKKVEFYRVNKDLCDNELYKDLKPTSILLYALLCDRLSVSYANENKDNNFKNKLHYYDENEDVYVIYTRIDLCSAFKDLVKANLIRELRQGKNKPNKIYVGKTISEIKEEFVNWKAENQTSGNPLLSSQEVLKSDTNKNNILNKKNYYSNYNGRDYSNMDWSKLFANSNF